MFEAIIEAFLDTIRIIPLLFVVYLALEFLQKRAGSLNISPERLNGVGPLLGGVVGCIPQCGFSAASAALYSESLIKGGTLIAVFLATSDEAIPVLISTPNGSAAVGLMIVTKLIIGVIAGYILNATLFRNDALVINKPLDIEYSSCESGTHHQHESSILKGALFHTVKISAYVLVTLVAINVAIAWLGDKRVSELLLTGSGAQPFVTALIGMIPGCSISVVIAQLLVRGQISFGSAIAGLCTGAGFGYVILARKCSLKITLKILAATYACGVIAGCVINAIGG